MKKFILRTCLFFTLSSILISIPLGLMYLKSPDDINTWFYGENLTKRNRIILVGSSNIYNNYDYEKLNNSFEHFDVIGNSIGAAVGFIPLISKLNQLDVQPSDIVVFCLPYQLFDKTHFINFDNNLALKAFSKKTLENGLKYNFILTYNNFYIQTGFNNWLDYIISKKEDEDQMDSLRIELTQSNLLNKTDYTSCIKKEDAKFEIKSLGFDEEYIYNFIRTISKYTNSKVYFRFPAVYRGKTEVNQEKLKYLSSNYDFINTYDSSFYDSIFWYDQSYHLNQCGAEKNTESLIRELSQIIK